MTDDELLILRTRPTTVEARRLSPDNQLEIARWAGGWTYGVTAVRWFSSKSGQVQEAGLGDWIVKGACGSVDRVSDRVLFSQYERITAAVTE